GWDSSIARIFEKHNYYKAVKDGSQLTREEKEILTTICVTYLNKGIPLWIAMDGKYLPTRPSRLSTLFQVALALHGAEMTVGYEHRDLHGSNVLLAKTSGKTREYRFGNLSVVVKTFGREVTIIDQGYCRFEKDGRAHSHDPNEEELVGDDDFDEENVPRVSGMKREMRRLMRQGWHRFVPTSNALWLCCLSRLVLSKDYHTSKMYTDRLLQHDRDVFRSLLTARSIGSWLNSNDVQELLKVVATTRHLS
ncbi:hypothetical protein PFISCL1PPCAC_10108, partial [Pristionchus fissidentatus]